MEFAEARAAVVEGLRDYFPRAAAEHLINDRDAIDAVARMAVDDHQRWGTGGVRTAFESIADSWKDVLNDLPSQPNAGAWLRHAWTDCGCTDWSCGHRS